MQLIACFTFKKSHLISELLVFSLFSKKGFYCGELNTLPLATCSVKSIWGNTFVVLKNHKYSHICFVGGNTQQLYCKTSCFAEHSPSEEMCFGSSEREMTVNHQVVIGIVWENSAQQQRDDGTEESSVGERLPWLPVPQPWHCHSFTVPL